jgi:hypothetical protein
VGPPSTPHQFDMQRSPIPSGFFISRETHATDSRTLILAILFPILPPFPPHIPLGLYTAFVFCAPTSIPPDWPIGCHRLLSRGQTMFLSIGPHGYYYIWYRDEEGKKQIVSTRTRLKGEAGSARSRAVD